MTESDLIRHILILSRLCMTILNGVTICKNDFDLWPLVPLTLGKGYSKCSRLVHGYCPTISWNFMIWSAVFRVKILADRHGWKHNVLGGGDHGDEQNTAVDCRSMFRGYSEISLSWRAYSHSWLRSAPAISRSQVCNKLRRCECRSLQVKTVQEWWTTYRIVILICCLKNVLGSMFSH